MESKIFLIRLPTLLWPNFREKTCFFPFPLNRSWLKPTRVPRRLLSKFSYSLFFTLLAMNVVKLNTNYASPLIIDNLSESESALHIWWTEKGFFCSKKKKKRQTTCNTNKKKISVNIWLLSLEPTWSGLNNMTIFFVRRFSFLNHSRQRKEALQGAKFGIK